MQPVWETPCGSAKSSVDVERSETPRKRREVSPLPPAPSPLRLRAARRRGRNKKGPSWPWSLAALHSTQVFSDPQGVFSGTHKGISICRSYSKSAGKSSGAAFIPALAIIWLISS